MAGEAQRTSITGRIEFVDTARGIAMLCIVLGHLGVAPINYVVYTFHVPIFFLITGWFVSRQLGVSAFAKKRARTLLVPYAATCVLIIATYVIRGAIGADGSRPAGEELIVWTVAALYGAGSTGVPLPGPLQLFGTTLPVQSIGAIWFLWACFWGCVGLRALLALKREWLRALIALAVALFGVFSAQVFFAPLSLQPGCVALGYMYLGYAAREYGWPWSQAWPRKAKTAAAVATGAVWVAYIFWRDTVVFVDAIPGLHWWSIFGILAGCVTVLVLSWLLTKSLPRVASPLRFLGKYSLIMLCVHMLEMHVVNYSLLADAIMAAGAPYVVAGGCVLALKFTLIFVFTWLLAKWAPSRKLFGFPPAAAGEKRS